MRSVRLAILGNQSLDRSASGIIRRVSTFVLWTFKYKKGRLVTEFETAIIFHSYLLENSENFLNFAKNSNELGQFLHFPEFSRAF